MSVVRLQSKRKLHSISNNHQKQSSSIHYSHCRPPGRGRFSSTGVVYGLLLGLLVSFSSSYADDTEVFFGQVDPTVAVHPNVLFVLDTSGSMNWYDSGEPLNRITRMKDALFAILDSASNINVGMMRFNGSNGGGPILYPVKYIDEEVCESGDCGKVNLLSRIRESHDDAEEQGNTGAVSLSGNVLTMTEHETSGVPQIVALRFTGLEVPQGATIESAYLEFTSHNDQSGSSTLMISAEDADDSAAFTNTINNLDSRVRTGNDVSWAPSSWSKDSIYQSPDIAIAVQEVVNRSGWCGGNAITLLVEGTGIRNAISFDQQPNSAPALRLSYDSTSIPPTGGCTAKTIVASVSSSDDDAEQRLSNNNTYTRSTDLELPRDGSRQQLVGMRFTNIQIPQGATIIDADIEFEIDRYRNGDVTLNIWGEYTNNASKYRGWRRNISNRPKTSAVVNWSNPPELGTNSKIKTPDIKTLVQEIVDKSGWESGNAMAFMMQQASGWGTREVESYNGEPAASPKLRIRYQASVGGSGTPTYITVRDNLKQQVSNLTAYHGTPIVDAFYEASQYYLGRPVDYGRERGYYRSRFHRVSHPDSYTGGTVSRPSGCTDANPDSTHCTNEQIDAGSYGQPTYTSPMTSSCQTNHIVILSDGEPTSNSAASKVRSLTGASSCEKGGSQACGKELANWLYSADHLTGMAGKQNISTYSIGFNLNSDFLKDLASAGGGQFHTASSSAQLVNVFQSILGDVLSIDTSFVAPGATVNQFNRLTHRNDIYFSLFKPADNPIWSGNLKKYNLATCLLYTSPSPRDS